jgi:predicted RNA binding protein YcfA (HicA-like mRNA interferase family)
MKFRDVRRRLKNEGWVIVVQEGSHEQWKHPDRPGRVTLAGKDNVEVKPGTLNSIFRQAGWKR